MRLDGHTKTTKAINDDALIEVEAMDMGKPKYDSREVWFAGELESGKMTTTSFPALESGVDIALKQLKGKNGRGRYDARMLGIGGAGEFCIRTVMTNINVS